MRLRLRQGNVLDAVADALVLPIDGSARGMEGNVARQFRARWGDDAWECVESAVEFPIALGTAACVDAEPPVPFRWVLLASTLAHIEGYDPVALARGALDDALTRATARGARVIASPLLRGGWRMPADRAFLVTVDALDARRSDDAVLEVHSLLPEHHEHLAALARSLGLRDALE